MLNRRDRHQSASGARGSSPAALAFALVLLAPALFASDRADAAWSYIAADEPLTVPSGAVVTTGDVLGTGSPQILVGSGTEVRLIRFDDGEEAGATRPSDPILLEGAQPVAPISSISAVDLNGDGIDELAIGTAGAGSLSLFQVTRWTPLDGSEEEVLRLDALSQLGYMWQEIVHIEVADWTGNGFLDLLAATADGEMTLFTYDVSESPHIYTYGPTWTGKPLDHMPWDQVSTVDWNEDGDTELVLSSTDDYLGIYDWTGSGWSAVWENYPWGRLTYVADWSRGGAPSLAVVTSQRILYNYGGTSGAFGLTFNTNEPLLVGSAFLTMTGPPPADAIGEEASQPDAPRLMVAGRAGLISFRVSGSELELESNTGFLTDVQSLFNLADGRLAVLTESSELWVLEPVSDEHLEIKLNGQASDLWRSPLVLEADLYLDVLDVARLLGNVDWTWDPETGALEMRRAGNRVELRAGEYAALWNEVVEVMPAPFRVVGNRPYVPADVIAYLGATVHWEAPYRRLTVETNSFWDWLTRR